MRLEKYSQLLESDSPTIEFSTENGKTILCQKQVNEMKKQLEQAEGLLQAMVEAKDVPTIEVIHRLRDLAKVLDHLKFQEECLVVGDCAIKLARAFGSRAVEFQIEEVQTILVIARLNVYKSQACPLFIQAIAICDAFAMMDGSDLAKLELVHALGTAGSHYGLRPELAAQWLSRALGLISELPSAMVTSKLRGAAYINYGAALGYLKAGSKALAVAEQAVVFSRSLGAGYGQMMDKYRLVIALSNYGKILHDMGHLKDALSVQQEAVSLCRTLAVDEHNEHKNYLADALHNYGNTLHSMGHLEDALSVRQEAVSFYRALAVDEHNEHKRSLAGALHNYGNTLHGIGHLEDALSVRQEAVSLYRALVVDENNEHKRSLAGALHNYGNTLHGMGHLKDALSVQQEAVSLCRALAVAGHNEHQRKLADALHNYGITLHDMGHLEDALSVRWEAVSLYRALAVDGHDEHKKKHARAIRAYISTRCSMDRLEDALSVRQETVSLSRTLPADGHEKHKNNLIAPAPSSSVEVCVPQRDYSNPLLPSATRSISTTPLSSPSTTQPSPLPTVSPSPSICDEALLELKPIDPPYSSRPSSPCVFTNQTPTPSAVIGDGSVSEHIS